MRTRPLVIFPEGVISRTNDRLNALMEGTALIAPTRLRRSRGAATPSGQVVVHPVALRYTFGGSIDEALAPALDDIESRLSWRPQRSLPLVDRNHQGWPGIVGLKEVEHLGATQQGDISNARTG